MKLLTILLLLLSLTACMGTDTGNPLKPADSSNENTSTPAPIMVSPFLDFETLICTRLYSCISTFPVADCRQKISTAENLSAAIGANVTTYPNLSSIISAYAGSALTYNSSALADCISGIDNLSCGQITNSGAFVSGTTTDYNSTYKLLTGISQCANIKPQ